MEKEVGLTRYIKLNYWGIIFSCFGICELAFNVSIPTCFRMGLFSTSYAQSR